MIKNFIQKKWESPESLRNLYSANKPYPHIVMENFINHNKLQGVHEEFPDLSKLPIDLINNFNSKLENKFSSKGVFALSKNAFELISFLNSEFFLRYLQILTGIEDTLMSDPYLVGGGYHEIKRDGFLKIHADFNKHPNIDFKRRLNLLIYLNKNWQESWGGDFQMYDKKMEGPMKRVFPTYNTCVIFTTTSLSYHGHPDPLMCPRNQSRKSLALYYFSGTKPNTTLPNVHGTIFKNRPEDAKAMIAEKDALVAEKDALVAEKDALVAEKEALVDEKNNLLNSASWKITSPLRKLKKIIKNK
jgi:Rps23 Pro-64 3,4-dihydroxylase Tpa1-like proline 4-hydroxylase